MVSLSTPSRVWVLVVVAVTMLCSLCSLLTSQLRCLSTCRVHRDSILSGFLRSGCIAVQLSDLCFDRLLLCCWPAQTCCGASGKHSLIKQCVGCGAGQAGDRKICPDGQHTCLPGMWCCVGSVLVVECFLQQRYLSLSWFRASVLQSTGQEDTAKSHAQTACFALDHEAAQVKLDCV